MAAAGAGRPRHSLAAEAEWWRFAQVLRAHCWWKSTASRPLEGGDRVESELALFAAERLAGQVAVHSAAIAMRGRVLLVPGPTGVGKSSLCAAAAAEAGATVLSDEYALVDPKLPEP